MSGIVDLNSLLRSMSPSISDQEYVFCAVDGEYGQYAHLNPVASFSESEGLTLVLPVESAENANLKYEARFRNITLTVHSSLEAVGLTAAVASKLASHNISANVIAAFYHDHVFVPSDKAELALSALTDLSEDAS